MEKLTKCENYRQAMDAVASNAVLGLSAAAPTLGIQTGLPLTNATVANSGVVANNFLNLNQVLELKVRRKN